MRVLFFNEGNLGSHIMGQSQLDDALHVGESASRDVETRFAGLEPMGPAARAATYLTIGPLARANLDFQRVRWHLVQSMRARRAVGAELAQWRADVVHIHTQSVALLMKRIHPRVPIVLSVDAAIRDWASMPAWRPTQRHVSASIAPIAALERRAFQAAGAILAWTPWAARAVARAEPEARVVEHHPGIDLTRYRPVARRPRDRPLVLFVGGRFREKGGEDLLAALGTSLGSELELDVVTPAPVVERPGMRVHRLTPSDPELLDLFQQADLLCLPTYGDAAPWAVLEAMACGTAVLSTRIGGIPDFLDEGRAGVLIRHGDRRALAESLRALLADPQRRAQLATRARARCEELYDARRQFPRLATHLAMATNERR